MMNLLIRADATTEMGTGHIMRCLALAQAWQEHGGRAVFLTSCGNEVLLRRIADDGFDALRLENRHPSKDDGEMTLKTLARLANGNARSETWIAVDGYHFDARYQRRIKEEGYKLLWIDDYGHADHYWADIVLNQNISADARWYLKREMNTRLLLGSEYALLRREFRSFERTARETAPAAGRVLVTMGGSDPDNTTVKVLRALQTVQVPALEVTVIIGPANPHRELIEEEIRGSSFPVHCVCSTSDMPANMAWADIAVSSGGSTCWELAFMGLPNVILITSENQRAISEALDAAGAAVYLGWQQEAAPDRIAGAIQQLLGNRALRKSMGETGQRLVDGLGPDRLLSACEALS